MHKRSFATAFEQNKGDTAAGSIYSGILALGRVLGKVTMRVLKVGVSACKGDAHFFGLTLQIAASGMFKEHSACMRRSKWPHGSTSLLDSTLSYRVR